jgi:hypothetical protein
VDTSTADADMHAVTAGIVVRATLQWLCRACRAGVPVLALTVAVHTVAMCSAVDAITLVKLLATIAGVRCTLAAAAAIDAAAVGPAVHLDRNFALVNDCVAHASTVAFVAGAHAVDTRAVRSTAISPVAAADTLDQ